MNPQQSDSEFLDFYEGESTAYRQPRRRDQLLDRWNEPSVILTALALIGAVVLKLYSPDGSLETVGVSIGYALWDLIVFLVPAPLLYAIDGWMSGATTTRPMSDAQPATHGAKSELMRRILGLDRSGGMMASVYQARTRALSVTGTVLGLKLDPSRPAGLGNRDNSCYQNSILQGLAALDTFPGYLSACVRTVDPDGQGQGNDVARTLRTLIHDLNDLSNNGKTIWTPSLLKSMSTWTQQDAQEYYSKMLDDIDRAVGEAVGRSRRHSGLEADFAAKASTSSQHSDDSGYQSLSSKADRSAMKPLQNPLEGLLAQRVACVQCGHHEGLSMIPFNCLTLSLGLDKSRHDLYERLDSYSRVEAIEGVECAKCTLLRAQRLLTKVVERMKDSSTAEQLAEPLRRLEAIESALEDDDFDDETLTEKCKISSRGKVSTTKTKQIVIARPPQSLAIHVNRSVFDPTTFDMIKNSAPVRFPLTLDLGPWCLGSSEGGRPVAEAGKADGDGDGDGVEERWQSDAGASMVAGDDGPSRLTGPIYELRAAVTHAGRHENGHYICYRKYPAPEAAVEAAAPDDDVGARDSDDADDGDGSEKRDDGDPVERQNAGWWRLSDHNVAKVDEETVLSLSPGVFMLFYQCVDAGMVLQSGARADLASGDASDGAKGAREGEMRAADQIPLPMGDDEDL
ncbi:hypothetical protein RJ55_05418 [Drechmeria coniospora]|nr:hypothetical protein RJ55_05418 [Drechmeria coniospora]